MQQEHGQLLQEEDGGGQLQQEHGQLQQEDGGGGQLQQEHGDMVVEAVNKEVCECEFIL